MVELPPFGNGADHKFVENAMRENVLTSAAKNPVWMRSNRRMSAGPDPTAVADRELIAQRLKKILLPSHQFVIVIQSTNI